jgi:hypothetical protein
MPPRRKISLPMRQPRFPKGKYRHKPFHRDVSSSRVHGEEKSDGKEQEEGPYNDNEAEVSSQEYLSVALWGILTFI